MTATAAFPLQAENHNWKSQLATLGRNTGKCLEIQGLVTMMGFTTMGRKLYSQSVKNVFKDVLQNQKITEDAPFQKLLSEILSSSSISEETSQDFYQVSPICPSQK